MKTILDKNNTVCYINDWIKMDAEPFVAQIIDILDYISPEHWFELVHDKNFNMFDDIESNIAKLTEPSAHAIILVDDELELEGKVREQGVYRKHFEKITEEEAMLRKFEFS